MTDRKKVAIFNDTRSDRGHYGCKAVMNAIETNLAKRGLDVVFSLPFNADWQEARDQLPAAGSIDAIIVNGEGSLHSAAKRPRVRSLAKLGLLASTEYQAPAYLINTTITNNPPEFYHDLKAFSAIYVRDTFSAEELENHGLKARVVPDVSMLTPTPVGEQNRRGIGITDSVILEDDLALRAHARKFRQSFRPMTEPARKIPVTSRVFLRPKYAIRKLREIRDTRGKRFADVDGFIEWLSSKEMIVTGRYHTITLCLLTRTPFLCFESNTPKISALLRDVGLSNERIIQTRADLSVKAREVLPFSADEHQAIERFLDQTHQKSKEMFDYIARDVEAAGVTS